MWTSSDCYTNIMQNWTQRTKWVLCVNIIVPVMVWQWYDGIHDCVIWLVKYAVCNRLYNLWINLQTIWCVIKMVIQYKSVLVRPCLVCVCACYWAMIQTDSTKHLDHSIWWHCTHFCFTANLSASLLPTTLKGSYVGMTPPKNSHLNQCIMHKTAQTPP